MKKNYSNRVYSDLASTEWGQRMWEMLNEPKQRERLIVASELGHPAVDGVALLLEQEFGAELEEDRARQMVGAMIRDILEPHGWTVAEQNVKVTVGEQFTVASRYHRVVSGPKASGAAAGQSFLEAMADKYGVGFSGRHYIEIPCGGATIGVDDQKSTGVRQVHIFSHRRAKTTLIEDLTPQIEAATPASAKAHGLKFRSERGQRSHARRYAGWRWDKASAGTQREQVQMATDLVEVLRAIWPLPRRR